MKKTISILILVTALLSLTCCTLAQSEYTQEIPCPAVQIDSVRVPGWDEQPQQ